MKIPLSPADSCTLAGVPFEAHEVEIKHFDVRLRCVGNPPIFLPMKTKILNHLREFPGSTTHGIVQALGLKRGSVSKCLTRLMFSNQIRGRLEQGHWRYSAVTTTPSPANSEAPATANA